MEVQKFHDVRSNLRVEFFFKFSHPKMNLEVLSMNLDFSVEKVNSDKELQDRIIKSWSERRNSVVR